jgi:phage terminase small subunit|tara:strand:+ start:96 stop:758 length:663 start_codon:yes stop_codon:yes gene_type:complete
MGGHHSKMAKIRHGFDNDPEVLRKERDRLEQDEEFLRLMNLPEPEFLSSPQRFNDPACKLRRTQMTALPFRLSPMQYKFAYEFIETGDAYQAYINTGYSVGDKKPFLIRGKAKELLQTPKVAAFVNYIRDKTMDKLSIKVEDIIEKFMSTYNQAMESADFTNANRALENLGKHLGMFVERQLIEQKVTMSSDELDREIAKYQSVIDSSVQKYKSTGKTIN